MSPAYLFFVPLHCVHQFVFRVIEHAMHVIARCFRMEHFSLQIETCLHRIDHSFMVMLRRADEFELQERGALGVQAGDEMRKGRERLLGVRLKKRGLIDVYIVEIDTHGPILRTCGLFVYVRCSRSNVLYGVSNIIGANENPRVRGGFHKWRIVIISERGDASALLSSRKTSARGDASALLLSSSHSFASLPLQVLKCGLRGLPTTPRERVRSYP
jgi:hypothetical protein